MSRLSFSELTSIVQIGTSTISDHVSRTTWEKNARKTYQSGMRRSVLSNSPFGLARAA